MKQILIPISFYYLLIILMGIGTYIVITKVIPNGQNVKMELKKRNYPAKVLGWRGN